MPPLSRAVREARRVLAKERVRRPAVNVERIARRYARVIERDLPTAVSGMLIPLNRGSTAATWAILINEDDAPVRQRFTIAHELGHLLLHRFTIPHADTGFKIRFRDSVSSEGRVREEIEANEFAAELLMPRDLVHQALESEELDYADDSSQGESVFAALVAQLSNKFNVSRQAMTVRLSALLG